MLLQLKYCHEFARVNKRTTAPVSLQKRLPLKQPLHWNYIVYGHQLSDRCMESQLLLIERPLPLITWKLWLHMLWKVQTYLCYYLRAFSSNLHGFCTPQICRKFPLYRPEARKSLVSRYTLFSESYLWPQWQRRICFRACQQKLICCKLLCNKLRVVNANYWNVQASQKNDALKFMT